MTDDPELTLFAESYSEVFEVPGGHLGVLADLHTAGDLIELRAISIYASEAEYLPVGTAQVRAIYRQIEAHRKAYGFKKIKNKGSD